MDCAARGPGGLRCARPSIGSSGKLRCAQLSPGHLKEGCAARGLPEVIKRVALCAALRLSRPWSCAARGSLGFCAARGPWGRFGGVALRAAPGLADDGSRFGGYYVSHPTLSRGWRISCLASKFIPCPEREVVEMLANFLGFRSVTILSFSRRGSR